MPLLLVSMLTGGLAVGCAKKDTAAMPEAAAADRGAAHAGSGAAATAVDAKALTAPIDDQRKVIRNGRIELAVKDYDDARAQIEAWVAQTGGYIDSTSARRSHDRISDATIVVRIPSSAFAASMPRLQAIGEVRAETTSASDITDEYVDVSARLASAQTLEKRLLELATARDGNLEQVLSVERELARVRAEIEGYEGHLRQWNDQVAMSTLTISIVTAQPELAVASDDRSLGQRSSQAFSSSFAALGSFGAGLLVVLIALAPWLVLALPIAFATRAIIRRYVRSLPRATAIAVKPQA